ncbi:hypothetical protein [Streptomyces sp. NBC_01589]|uniref:hypothetical protein n=1 Tax=unclassified Streptomyces TaxID=2593676 RepID=UPI00386705C9
MRTTVDHFTAAEEVALGQARAARTIADTFAAMYPSAAYLVPRRPERFRTRQGRR